MRGDSPFVVVLAAAARRVGRSTLAGNLAVYLRGLVEDLPIGVISFDPGYDPAQTFALAGSPTSNVADLFSGNGIEACLGLGQFGVDYLESGICPSFSASQLRRLLRDSHYPGILIIDAGALTERPSVAALQAADLVLTPLRDAAGLAALAGIRRELRAGGGSDKMLWLIPAMVENLRAQERQLQLLRFAARERGCQVLDAEFVMDQRLPQATQGTGGSVLTRLPDSLTHQMLHHLAQLVLRKYESGPEAACQLQRLRLDNALPARFHRVEVICPLCGELACLSPAHYCESLPQRRRWLLHADCMAKLMEGRELQPFWKGGQSAVLRTGVEGDGLLPQLRLLLPDADGLFFESEFFSPPAKSGWQTLVRRATDRTLEEQFPSLIMIYPAISGRRVLTDRWYRSCLALRKRLRIGLSAEF